MGDHDRDDLTERLRAAAAQPPPSAPPPVQEIWDAAVARRTSRRRRRLAVTTPVVVVVLILLAIPIVKVLTNDPRPREITTAGTTPTTVPAPSAATTSTIDSSAVPTTTPPAPSPTVPEIQVPDDAVFHDPGADAIRAHDAALKARGVTASAYVTDPRNGQVLIFVTGLTPEMEAAARDVLGDGDWVLVDNTGCVLELGC